MCARGGEQDEICVEFCASNIEFGIVSKKIWPADAFDS